MGCRIKVENLKPGMKIKLWMGNYSKIKNIHYFMAETKKFYKIITEGYTTTYREGDEVWVS